MADQKGLVSLEVKKEDRLYSFTMPMGSPLGECYDACHEFLLEVIEMAKTASDKAKREEKKDDKKK